MTDKNIFMPWCPISLLDGYYDIEAVHDDYEGFRILLKGDKKDSRMLGVKFDDPYSYKVTDESYHFNFGVLENKEHKVFFTVDNSTYIDSFHENSSKTYEDLNIVHYAIYVSNSCVDVLSTESPSVGWLN